MFYSVTSSLAAVEDLNWPDDLQHDALDFDPIDEPVDSSEDGIITIDEEQTVVLPFCEGSEAENDR